MLYVWLGNTLDPATTFTALGYLNLMRFPLALFPMVISFMVEGFLIPLLFNGVAVAYSF